MGLQSNLGKALVDASHDDAVAITPSDTTVLSDVRALLVTATGQISVVTQANYAAQEQTGAAEVVVNLGTGMPVGTVIPIAVAKVKAATLATVVGLL